MIFIAKADGSLSRVIPSAVNQGSVGVNELVLIAPYPKVSAVTAAFILPNGIRTKPNLATLTEIPDVIEGTAYNAWVFELTAAITEYAGNVTVQFYVTSADEKVLATYADTFPVAKGGKPEMPDAPTDDIYNQILTAYSNVDARLSTAEGNIVSIRGEIGADYESGTVKGRLTASEISIGYNQSEINHTKHRVSENERDISDIEDAIGTDDTEGTVKGRITKAESDISGINTDIGTDEATESIKGRITIAEGDIDSLESKMATAEGDIDSLEGKVGEAQANISTLFSKVGNLVQLKNVTFDESSDILTVTFSTENGGEKKIEISLADFIDATELSSVIEEEVSKNAKEYVDRASASAISAEASADKAEEYAQEAKESADSAKSAYAEQVAVANKAASEAKASHQAAESAKSGAEVQAEIATQAAENAQQSATLAQQSASTANSVVSSLAPRVSAAEKRLTNLEKGITPDPFVTDDTVAYQKTVPENALPFAAIERVGGMSYKSKNLFGGDALRNAIVAAGGTYDASLGTATASGSVMDSIGSFQLTFKENAQYTLILSGFNKVVGSKDTNIVVRYTDGSLSYPKFATYDGATKSTIAYTTATGKTIKSINGLYASGTSIFHTEECGIFEGVLTAEDFEPYFEGIRHAAVAEIESVGVNLFDGTVSVKGDYLVSDLIPVKPNTEYRVNVRPSNGVKAYRKDKSLIKIISYNADFVTTDETYFVQLAFTSSYGTVYNSDIILCEGTTVLPYVPYVKHTFPIPEAVQALDGYGWGTSATYNNHFAYEDDGSVTWHKKFGGVDMGTLSWEHIDSKWFAAPVWDKAFGLSNLLCDKYSLGGVGFSGIPDKSITGSVEYHYIYVVDSDYTDVATFKAAMSGVMLYYELEIPEVTDITHLISPDNFITVEGGGTITVVNEHGLAAPSTILYMTKEETV